MEFLNYDGLGLAELVRNGDVTPLELVDQAITQIEKTNPSLNAVVHQQFDRARDLARKPIPEGPFKGVPFLFKDLGAFEPGVPSTAGSRFSKDFKPDFQSEIVKRYYEAGFIPLGRTNTPEMGLLPTTESALLGPARNPWNVQHSTGGSSGGSAAAVSAGMVPLAHAGDGGGSIRIPSSCCGVFGLKPTEGRSPIGPVGGRLWHGLAVEHVISRSVRDSAAALDVISNPLRGAPLYAPPPERSFLSQLDAPVGKLKIALVEDPFFRAELHKDCRTAVNDAARLCESLGHTVVPIKLDVDADKVSHAYTVVVAGETDAAVQNLAERMGRKPTLNELEPLTHICCLGGRAFSATDYAHGVRIMDEARRKVAQTFALFDLVLTPTLALPPPRIGELDQSMLEAGLLKLLRRVPSKRLLRLAFKQIPKSGFKFAPYTFLFNLTGQPAMSVPLFWNAKGLPIGSHFVAEFGGEGLLLRLAKQLDEARPFLSRRPKVIG